MGTLRRFVAKIFNTGIIGSQAKIDKPKIAVIDEEPKLEIKVNSASSGNYSKTKATKGDGIMRFNLSNAWLKIGNRHGRSKLHKFKDSPNN